MTMGAMGAFNENGADLGAAFAMAFILVAVVAFTALIGPVVAAITGHYIAMHTPTRAKATTEGALLGGLGHAGMVLALMATLFVGFAILPPSSGEGSESGTSETDGAPVDYDQLFKLVYAVIPAALVGAASGWALWSPLRPAPSSPFPIQEPRLA